jgi:TonB family protein
MACSQSAAPQIATKANSPKPKITYPDTQSGLKQLASDIIAAQKENSAFHAQELLDSLVLPNFREWYVQNFSEVAVARALPTYSATAPTIPMQLASIFLNAYQGGFHTIEAVRYDDESGACSSAPIFSAMTMRKSRVPLYELRFIHGDNFKRIFAFAYVDGTFRLVLTPNFSKSAGQVPDQANSSTPNVAKPQERVPAGAVVQSAKLVCRVQPYYPEDARRQRISGTVKFHTIIGADGNIKQLEVLTGPPALVTAAKDAVSQWRYHPTLVNGEPIEIDTTIDVIFSLNP